MILDKQIKTIELSSEQKILVNSFIESVREVYSHKNTHENGRVTKDGKKRRDTMYKLWDELYKTFGFYKLRVLQDLAMNSVFFELTPEEIYSIFTSITKVKIEEVTA